MALSSLDRSVPLVLPANLTSNVESIPSGLDSNVAYQNFYISSKVALAVGAAIDYANRPRPSPLGVSTYHDIYDRMESLVSELIMAAETASDSYVFCEATSLADR